MKNRKSSLLLPLLFMNFSVIAQVQWYQNQNGNDAVNGTFATSIAPFNSSSFIACYQWSTINDQSTWKISKSSTNGNEQRSLFLTGAYSMVEAKVGHYNTVYVLQQNFPAGQNAEYILYKLDNNLVIRSQRTITVANNLTITSFNAFETDDDDNIYVAGDAQYTNASGIASASFVIKADRNLAVKWKKVDYSATSYSRLHIDRYGRVIVLQNSQAFFPNVKITRISANGNHASTFMVLCGQDRFSFLSKLDDDDDLILYGGKSVGDTVQAMYLSKVSMMTGRVVYNKTYFVAPGSQVNDFKMDRHGNIFSLVMQFFSPDSQLCKVSRINSGTGNINWNRTFNFRQDSSILLKLVMDDDQFYVIGEQRKNLFYSRGLAIRMKKNGQIENSLASPDSVSFNRAHLLIDGIINNNQLIAVGNANDFDETIYSSTSYRAFAVKYDNNRCNNNNVFNRSEAITEPATEGVLATGPEETIGVSKPVVYPNPAHNFLNIANINTDDYDNLAVYTMQGALLLKQSVNGNAVRVDVSNLVDGIYLLVLRSTATQKEKPIKFVVRK